MFRSILCRSTSRLTAVVTSRSTSVRCLSTGGAQLAALTQEQPHVDVVKYHHKNRTWTLNHVHYYSEALAIGLVENGLQPGDVVLSWLPSHFSEQVNY